MLEKPVVYSNYVKTLTTLCKKRGFRLQKIGVVACLPDRQACPPTCLPMRQKRRGHKKEYPIFAITFNNSPKIQRTICLVGGLHGEEPAGPLALLKFLQTFQPKKYPKTKIIILPVANPTGFDRGVRKNFLGWDINRHFFDKKLVAENKIICNFLKNEKIDILHTLHEDFERKEFYLYILEHKESGVAKKIIKFAKRFFPIYKKRLIEGCVAKDGVITYRLNKNLRTMTAEGSLENWAFYRGTPLVLATEAPIQTSLAKRIGFYIKLLNFLLRQ
ncbi:MAG: succinylglutamate desuccinylase/aspartoacylase family protein [Patescibacteria group bacterium]